jgi:hypothetical protein
VRFAVVVELHPEDLAADLGRRVHLPTGELDGGQPRFRQVEPIEAVSLRLQNWTLGEVLLLDDDGRELDGDQRKPSKWGVRTEPFDDLDAAIARAREVLDAGS